MSSTKQNKKRMDSEQTFLWMHWPVLFCVCVRVTMHLCVCVAWLGQALGKKKRVEKLSPGKEGLHVWTFWHAAPLTRSKWGQGDHIALLANYPSLFFCLLVRLRVCSLNDGDTVGCTLCLPSKHFPHSAPSKLNTFPSHTSLGSAGFPAVQKRLLAIWKTTCYGSVRRFKISLLLVSSALNKEVPFWRPAAPLSGENGAVLITATAGVKTDTASFKQWRRLVQWHPLTADRWFCVVCVSQRTGCHTDITHRHLSWSQRSAASLTVEKMLHVQTCGELVCLNWHSPVSYSQL